MLRGTPIGFYMSGGTITLKSIYGTKNKLEIFSGLSRGEEQLKEIYERTHNLFATGEVASTLGFRVVEVTEKYKRFDTNPPLDQSEIFKKATFICKFENGKAPIYLDTKVPKDEEKCKEYMKKLTEVSLGGHKISSVYRKPQWITI